MNGVLYNMPRDTLAFYINLCTSGCIHAKGALWDHFPEGDVELRNVNRSINFCDVSVGPGLTGQRRRANLIRWEGGPISNLKLQNGIGIPDAL